MKIIKILFLGIVLVLFNIAYLAAQAPADTVFVKTKPVAPGGVLEITYEVHVNSEGAGGIIIVVEGVPAQITPVGADWYTWGEGFGSVLADESSWPKVVTLDAAGLSVAVLGVDIDDLVADGDLASKSGDFITYMLQVPEDMALGSYPLVRSSKEDGVSLPSYPIPGPNIQPYPAVIADAILVTEMPDYNALQLPVITAITSTGGVLKLPINVENKDEIGSGSFKVSFPANVMSLTGVIAASRAGGMVFTIADVSTSDGVTTATITFTGGAVALGGLAELCSLEFEVSALTAGAISISLADVSLSDATGAGLSDLQQPTVGTAEPEMVFGDSLIVGVKPGAHQVGQADEATGISVIENGQLLLPVLLTNSKPVSVLDFFIQKVPGNEAITLTLAEIELARAAGWIIESKDTVDFVRVVSYQSPTGDPIAVGEGEILTLVFDIGGYEGVITPDNSVDVSLLLKGVEVVDSDGNFLAVQLISNAATIDYRVPLSAEGLGSGASLPKAFALSQNHPNPFNPSTTINYQIPEDVGFVSFSLNVYDIRGSLVRTLANGVKGPGYYTAHWDGTDNNGRQLSSGVYFYRFHSDKYTSTRKMVLLK